MKVKLNNKGVALVEYAVLLSFISAIALSFGSSNGLMGSISGAVNKATSAINMILGVNVFSEAALKDALVGMKDSGYKTVQYDHGGKHMSLGSLFPKDDYFMDCGFNLHDTMIYEKAQACFGSNLCYLQSFEYMFVFSKGKPKSINLIRDRKNVRHGEESMASSGLSKDGKKASRCRKVMSEYGKRKNIWRYGVGGGKTGHPAVFPEQLASDHILSWSNPSDVVFDPFMGSGTTAKMAMLNGRKFVGCEISEEYCNIIKERLDAIQS